MKLRLITAIAALTLGMSGTANAATHYHAGPTHSKFTTQAQKDHIVSVVINCIDGSVDSDCLNAHYIPYLTLVYTWTSNNTNVAEGGCGYGNNDFINTEFSPPHARFVIDKNGNALQYPPKPGALTRADLHNIWLEAFCYGITTDTTQSNTKEADEIFNAEQAGLLQRVHAAAG